MTILLLHGFTGSGASWNKFIEHNHLSDVSAPDLPGHGDNLLDDPAGYTMEATAAALMEEAGDTPMHLFGYSMGGRLALYLALTYPDRFASLTLESASPGLKTEAERAARRASDEALADRIVKNGIAAFVEEWEKLPLWSSQSHTMLHKDRQALHEQRLRNDPRGLANSLRGMGTGVQPSLWDRLTELKMPILLLTGEQDSKFTGLAREMKIDLPHAQHTVIPNAGHAVHLEQAVSVRRTWSEFLEDLQ